MRRINMHQKGFTLIELILYVGIVGTLLLGMTAFFAMSAEARVKNQSISEVNQQGSAALERITQVLRGATSITTPAAATTGTALTVVVPTAAKSPTVVNLSGTVLQIKEGSAAALPLTNSKVHITDLTVKNLTRSGTSGILQISLTVGRVGSSNNAYDYTRTFTTSVSLRP